MSLGREALDEMAATPDNVRRRPAYGRVQCSIIHTTEGAFHLKVGTEFFWCPKSQVAIMVQTKVAGVWEATIKLWVLVQSRIPCEEIDIDDFR